MATASVARAKQNSQSANKYAVWAAASAVTMTLLLASDAPGTNDPTMGAGNTEKIKDRHFCRYEIVFPVICSDVDFHVRPTKPALAKRRFPTLMARSQKPFVSWRAKETTAALNTLINGHAKYNSFKIDVVGVFSIKIGTKVAKMVAVADTPTHKGVIAFARSALARKPSASDAQQMVAAATSLPSATATRPTYSAPIPIAAEKAAAVGGKTSNNFPCMIQGDDDAAVTLALNKTNSKTVNCGFCPAKLSNSCISNSKFDNAAHTCSSRLEEDVTICPVRRLLLFFCSLFLLFILLLLALLFILFVKTLPFFGVIFFLPCRALLSLHVIEDTIDPVPSLSFLLPLESG
mmetsp:Transcript_62605/g.70851  ORF Transcript_62605/g.70851 Transcript_62605/m.70851 type:complete len:348 (+) Transcript_62605:662-1705(+)